MWQHPPVTYKVNIHLSCLCERWLCKMRYAHRGKSYFSSFVFNLHWIRNTFFHSFISIIKVTTVCDHRYLEKRINIVGCWCIISTQWVKFFCWPWEDSLPDNKKVQRSNRKAFVIWRASRWLAWLGDEYWHGKHIALWTACYYKASLENSLSGVYNIVLGFSVLL